MSSKQNTKASAKKRKDVSVIEQDYLQVFTPRSLPYQGLYTDEDSLEQPSELQEIPSTSAPCVET
jgi:hypothetical protein